MIRFAVSKYPPEFLRKHLSRIVVFNQMSFAGTYVGGTYYEPSTIFITFSDSVEPYWNENLFHHEVSSLLYHKFYNKVMGVGLVYKATGPGDVSGEGILERDENLLEEGFLYAYAQQSPEEDFNSFCAALLTPDPRLWKDAEQFSKVRRKLTKTIKFYSLLDKGFNEAHFRSLLDKPAGGPH